jgi:CBS domain-containing protein
LLEDILSRRLSDPIATVMTAPVEAIDIGEPIESAMCRLASTNLHGLVVVDGETPVGVYSHREALSARRLPPSLRDRPVEEVMSYETICLGVHTPIHRAAAYGLAMNVRRFLAIEDEKLVGVVSSLDLVGALARQPPA